MPGPCLVCGSVAVEKKNPSSCWIRAEEGRRGEGERRLSESERKESSLNGPTSLRSVIRLRFKSARLETRDERPVVSDNGLLFFRGQMLDQNCRQYVGPSAATPARGPVPRRRRELKVSEGGGRRRHVSLRHFTNHPPIYPCAVQCRFLHECDP